MACCATSRVSETSSEIRTDTSVPVLLRGLVWGSLASSHISELSSFWMAVAGYLRFITANPDQLLVLRNGICASLRKFISPKWCITPAAAKRGSSPSYKTTVELPKDLTQIAAPTEVGEAEAKCSCHPQGLGDPCYIQLDIPHFSASTNVRWLPKQKKHMCSLLQISYTGKKSEVKELDGDGLWQ